MDTLRRFCDGDPTSRMNISLDAEASWSGEGRGPATPLCCKGTRGRTQKDHGGLPRGTPTTPTPSSPAGIGMDETAGIAKSPGAATWECPDQVAEEATTAPRVRLERVLHLLTKVGKVP